MVLDRELFNRFRAVAFLSRELVVCGLAAYSVRYDSHDHNYMALGMGAKGRDFSRFIIHYLSVLEMIKLTPHFTLNEMKASKTAEMLGIKNEPSWQQIEALTLLCLKTLEPIRALVGKPVRVTSGYRCQKLNKQVGGAQTSQHQKGEAADIHVDGLKTQELFDMIVASNIPFDQIIQEFDQWVHISFSKTRERRSVLYALRDKNGKVYYASRRRFVIANRTIKP